MGRRERGIQSQAAPEHHDQCSAQQRVGLQHGLTSLVGYGGGCWTEAMLLPSMRTCCPSAVLSDRKQRRCGLLGGEFRGERSLWEDGILENSS